MNIGNIIILINIVFNSFPAAPLIINVLVPIYKPCCLEGVNIKLKEKLLTIYWIRLGQASILIFVMKYIRVQDGEILKIESECPQSKNKRKKLISNLNLMSCCKIILKWTTWWKSSKKVRMFDNIY